MGLLAVGPEPGADDIWIGRTQPGRLRMCRRGRSAAAAGAAGGRAKWAMSPELRLRSGALCRRRGHAVAVEVKTASKMVTRPWITVARNRTGSGRNRQRYLFGSRGMNAATARAERSEGLGFPRDCITPVATACVSSPGTRTLTGSEAKRVPGAGPRVAIQVLFGILTARRGRGEKRI